MHSKLTKFLCLQLQFIPDLSRFSSTNCQQTELLKKSNAASISGSFRHVVLYIAFVLGPQLYQVENMLVPSGMRIYVKLNRPFLTCQHGREKVWETICWAWGPSCRICPSNTVRPRPPKVVILTRMDLRLGPSDAWERSCNKLANIRQYNI